jgi:acyl-CoA hydrolase
MLASATGPESVLEHIGAGADLIVPLANGEPVSLLDAVEAHAERLDGVKIHQMHTLHDRPYLHGAFGDRLRHVSYFLSHVTRPCFQEGTIDLVPNNFSEMRDILRERTRDPLVLAAASPLDRHGYFSLGVNADYVSSFIGRARFFLEANRQQPRTFGRNQVHVSQVLGWVEADRPLVEVPPSPRTDDDDRIAAFVAERIPNGATIQTGIGAIPNAILSALSGHRDLGVHTELISDGLMDLVDRGVVTGVAKQLNRTKTVGTFALGTARLYDFLDENAAFELWPVRYVNDPRVIAQEAGFVSINSTISVDLIGPVRLRDRRRHLLLLQRRSGRLRPRRDVLARRPGLRGAALDREAGIDLQDRSPARPWRRRHDPQEHRRQGRRRMGGGRRAADHCANGRRL